MGLHPLEFIESKGFKTLSIDDTRLSAYLICALPGAPSILNARSIPGISPSEIRAIPFRWKDLPWYIFGTMDMGSLMATLEKISHTEYTCIRIYQRQFPFGWKDVTKEYVSVIPPIPDSSGIVALE